MSTKTENMSESDKMEIKQKILELLIWHALQIILRIMIIMKVYVGKK